MATQETTERPVFNRLKFDSDASKHQKQVDDEKLPRVLNRLGINSHIIEMAEAIHQVYNKNHDKNFTYDIGLISHCTNFLQRVVNLNDPNMIREFALFFRRTVEQHAVRFTDSEGSTYINASLGEIDEQLYSSEDPKRILFVTAFYTKGCLTYGENPDTINHIVDNNDTIEYQSDKIIRNAIQCINNVELTDDGFKELMKTYIARTDAHVTGGISGKGNKFDTFFDDVNNDPDLSSFCNDFRKDLQLKETLKMDDKRISSYCRPILIDMILGICNVALYAAYVHAKGQTLHIYLASSRSRIIFEPNVDGTYHHGPHGTSDIASISLGFHPNYVKSNLTNDSQTLEHMRQLDNGITSSLEPLRGVHIRAKDGDGEKIVEFKCSQSDFFQRLYQLRLSGGVAENDDLTHIEYQHLEKAKREMRKLEKEAAEKRKANKKAKEDLQEVKKDLKEAHKEMRKAERHVKKKRREEEVKKTEEEVKHKREKEVKEKSEKSDSAARKLDILFGKK